MRNFKTEGIIIKRRNFKDSDRILTVLTKTNGKIYIRASGVRKINSRRAGHIEPLNHSILALYQGHAFPVLTEASTINNFSDIKKDLGLVGHAYHLCELVDGLCPENQENIRVFYLLKQTLEQLGQDDYSSSEQSESRSLGTAGSRQARTISLISNFEMQLLSILGYWNKANFAQAFDTQDFIENILERRLKTRRIFAKIQQ